MMHVLTTTSCFAAINGTGNNFIGSPTLEDMLKFSENPEAYAFYFEHYLGYVVQPKFFDNALRQYPKRLTAKVDKFAKSRKEKRNLNDEFVTVAEEALGLFVIANYQKVWDAQINNNNTDVEETPTFTRARNKGVNKQKEEGVIVELGEHISSEGRTYYNELLKKVQADRKLRSRKNWEEKQLKQMSDKRTKQGKRKVREVTPPKPKRTRTVTIIPSWKHTSPDDGSAGSESDDSSD
jgi:polyhydroxyalkanoate synthesis regulator phasin